MKQTFVILFGFVATLACTSCNSYGQKQDSINFINSSSDTNVFILNYKPPKTYILFKVNGDIEIRDGDSLVAEKKKGGNWILINPDKTRIVLDSVMYILKPKEFKQ